MSFPGSPDHILTFVDTKYVHQLSGKDAYDFRLSEL